MVTNPLILITLLIRAQDPIPLNYSTSAQDTNPLQCPRNKNRDIGILVYIFRHH